jgi:hypothetical protein
VAEFEFEGQSVVIRPAAKHTLEFLGGAVAVIALAGGILAFKLASGPVSLKFMAPTFAALLKQGIGQGYGFEVADAHLSWSQRAGALALTLSGVNLYDRSGLLVAGVPELEVGVSLDGLQHGMLAPTRVSLQKASILIERDPSGAFSIGAPAPPAAAASSSPSVLPFIFDSVFAPAGKRTVASYLSEVNVENADLTLIDRRTGITVRAPDARLNLVRTQTGYRVGLEASAAVADERAHIVLAGTYNLKAQSGALDASFTPIRLSHLAGLSKFYAAFAPLDMPIGGEAHLDLGRNALITRADLVLSGGGGRLLAGGRNEAAVAVESVGFDGTYWPQTGEITVDALKFQAGEDRGDFSGHAHLRTAEGAPLRVLGASFVLIGKNVRFVWPDRFAQAVALDTIEAEADVTFGSAWQAKIKTAKLAFGPTRIEVAGEAAAGAGSPAMRLDGLVTDFPAGEIATYWPQGVAVHARNWVTRHVRAGRIVKGALSVNAPAGAFVAAQVDPSILKFDFRLEGAESTYFGNLPPVTDVTAQAVLTPSTFDLKIEKASILDTKFTGGRVSIPQLGVKNSPIDIEAEGSGRIEQILDVINREPLHLVTKYGLKPEDITGDASVQLALTVPQESDNPDERVTFSVIAKGEHVTLPKIAQHVTLDSGVLDLKVNQSALEGRGRIAINGAPADIVWREQFSSTSATPSEFTLHTSLDEEARTSLGFDTGTSVTGPVVVDVTARGKGPSIRAATATIDLSRASLKLADFGWAKPVGAAAKVNLDIAIAPDGAINAKQVRASGQGIDVSGSAKLARDGKLLAANFSRLHIDGVVDVALATERNAADGLVVKINGPFLKLGPILKEAANKGSGKLNTAWRVEAALDRAVLRNAVEASDVRATIAASGGRLKTLDATGHFPGGTGFSANLSDLGDSTRRMTIESADAGRLIEGVIGIKSIVGGHFSLNAKFAAQAPAAGKSSGSAVPGAASTVTASRAKTPAGIEGVLRVEDFKVVDAPLLARLLSVGSLQGIGDLLNGEGIQFARLQVPFWMERDQIGIEEARAAGPAIGITLQGIINRGQSTSDLSGSIVPAYTINSALGSVPVLGPLLISRQGEGIFGFTYNVTGAMDDPRMMVNPLSALAPGFLRRLFELGDVQAGNARPSERPVAR